MRVHINSREWYPVYSAFEAEDGKYEVADDLIERNAKAREAFEATQDELDDAKEILP